ncbi:MAG: hypothetical protein IID36_06325, partial [Planctomycetes bacterium]|nr:hypothetical protein [Planctomycetota bacterium]
EFHVNPLVPNCSGVKDCSGNGECIGQDLCVCDEGWSGDDCSMNCTPCLYGDITSASLCVPTCTGVGTDVDFDDVLCALNGFALAADCPCADIAGAVETPCIPDGVINFDDILAVLNAFAGDSTCPAPGI